MAGACQLVGEIVKISPHLGCGFMESSPGVSDVYMPLHVCNGCTEGDIVSVEVLPHFHGRNRWKVTRTLENVSSSQLEDSRFQRLDNPDFLDKIVRFVASKGGEILVFELFDLFVAQPKVYRVVKASGGLQEYCRKNGRLLEFHRDEEPENSGIKTRAPARSDQKILPGTQASTLNRSPCTRHTNAEVENVLQCLEVLVEAHDGDMDEANVQLLFENHTGAEQIIRAAGGIARFCELHDSRVCVIREWRGTRLVLKQERGDRPTCCNDFMTGGSSHDKTDSWPTLGFESSQITSAAKEMRHGNLVSRQTAHAAFGGGADAQMQGAAQKVAAPSTGAAAWASVAKRKISEHKPGANTGTLELAGKVAFIGRQGHAFMESAPEVVDVRVPWSILERWPQAVDVGDFLFVLAEEHHNGNSKYKATTIVAVHPGEKQPTAKADTLQSQSPEIMDVPRCLPDGAHLEHVETSSFATTQEAFTPSSSAGPEDSDNWSQRDGFDTKEKEEETDQAKNKDKMHAKHSEPGGKEKNTTIADQGEAWGSPPLLDALVRTVTEHGGTLDVSKLQLLYKTFPTAKKELKATGGLKRFCEEHRSLLRYEVDGGTGRVVLRHNFVSGTAKKQSSLSLSQAVTANRFELLPIAKVGASSPVGKGHSDADGDAREDGTPVFKTSCLEIHKKVDHDGSPTPVPSSEFGSAGSDSAGEEETGQAGSMISLWADVQELWYDEQMSEAKGMRVLKKVVQLASSPGTSLPPLTSFGLQDLFADLCKLGVFCLAKEASSALRGKFEVGPGSADLARCESMLRGKTVQQHASLLLAANAILDSISRDGQLRTEKDCDLFDQILIAVLYSKSLVASFFSQLASGLSSGSASGSHCTRIMQENAELCLAEAVAAFKHESLMQSPGDASSAKFTPSTCARKPPLSQARLECAVASLFIAESNIFQPLFPHILEDELGELNICFRPWCHRVLCNVSGGASCSCGCPMLPTINKAADSVRNQFQQRLKTCTDQMKCLALTQQTILNNYYFKFRKLSEKQQTTYSKLILKLMRSLCEEDGEMLGSLTKAPAKISSVSGLEQWWALSWVPLFEMFGGIEMVLLIDSDAEASGRTAKLFPQLYRAVMKLFNACRQSKVQMDRPKSFLASFLCRVATVPEFSSDKRISTAQTTLKIGKTVPNLFSYSLPRPCPLRHLQSGDGRALERALDSCRPVLVSEVMGWGAHMQSVCNEKDQELPPLHRVCALQPPKVQASCTLSTSGRGPQAQPFEREFEMGGFRWLAALGSQVDADGMSSFRLRVLLRDVAELGDAGQLFTDVTVSTKPESTIRSRAIFSRRHPVATFLLPVVRQHTGIDISLGIALCIPAQVGCGGRRVRSESEWRDDQGRVIAELLQNHADVDVLSKSGRLAWSIAVENGAPESIRALVMPRNIVSALNAIVELPDPLHMHEVWPLVQALPAKQEVDLNLASFVGRRWQWMSDGSVPVSRLLASLLTRRIVPRSLILAFQAAMRKDEWSEATQLLDHISRHGIPVPCAFPLHDAVTSNQQDVVKRLLDLNVDPDTQHDRPGTGSETALHVACRLQNVDAVQLLVSKECKMSPQNTLQGDTPLHLACESVSDNAIVIVGLLLEAGADHAAVNKKKRQPAAVARLKKVRKMLKDHEQRSQVTTCSPKLPSPISEATQKAPRNGHSARRALPMTDPADSDHDIMEKASTTLPSAAAAEVRQCTHQPSALTYEERLKAVWQTVVDLSSIPADETEPPLLQHVDSNTSAPGVDIEVKEDAKQGPLDKSSPATESHVHVVDHAEPEAAEPGIPSPKEPDTAIAMQGMLEEKDVQPASPEEEDGLSVLASQELAWDLRCTREFKEQLFSAELRSNRPLLQGMLRNICRLARGEQSRGLMKLLKGTPKSLRLFESPCKTFNDGGRFLWQFAVDYSPRIAGFCETIRLWKICLQHDQVPKAMENIVLAHKRGRTSTVKHALRTKDSETCVQRGKRFPRNYEVEDGANCERVRLLLEAEQGRFEQLVEGEEAMQEASETELYTPPAIAAANSYNVLKFYALNSRMLDLVSSLSSSASPDVEQETPEFPFIPDQREDAIICCGDNLEDRAPSSTLLVGRSGTGKTSIALGKLWRRYERWHTKFQVAEASGHAGDVDVYHQVFVTANKVLRDQVRKSFEGMRNGMLGQKSQLQTNEYPPTLDHIPEGAFPLFLTQLEWLGMLDGTLENPFFPRHLDGSLVEEVRSGFHEEDGMLDSLPAEDDWWTDSDDDNEDGGDDQEESAEAGARPPVLAAATNAKQNSKRKVEIDSRMFHKEIWPKIRDRMSTGNISPSTLFQEIHSYIKGSHMAMDKPSGFLSREEYLRLPIKMAPNFRGLGQSETQDDLPADQTGSRSLVYTMFEMYEDMKRKRQAYDNCDLVHHVWNGLKEEGYNGTHIDSVFVDEAQDFTQAELRLFIRTCRDKNDMFFSGDTCQTIASGVGFRFEDLRSLFKAEQDQHVQTCSPGDIMITVPQVSVLTVNYRTHNGILSVAAAMVDLLEAFFTGTIDVLPRENGFFDGPKPILLSETNKDDAILLVVGADRKTSQIEFGANQVILVRTQESKKLLPPEFDSCLAMTVLESKGLEFDDVFLWNFLTESRAENEWRVLFSYLIVENEGVQTELAQLRSEAKASKLKGMYRELEFCKDQHLILCEELKQLYTAITRARVRVIIYEQDEAKRAPMFYFLHRKDLVQVLSYFSAEPHAPLTVQTSAEEWHKQGLNLKDNGMLLLAAKCFARAGEKASECDAMGQHLAEQALRELDASKRKIGFFNAAERFLQAGHAASLHAANCFAEAGEWELAAKLFMLSPGSQFLNKAVQCYRKLGQISKAADLLHEHGKVRRALELLRKEGQPQQALVILDRNPTFVAPQHLTETEFVEMAIASLPYGRENREKFLTLVRRLSNESQLQHLRKPGFRQELKQKFQELGRVLEVAKVLVEDNCPRDALQLMESVPDPDPPLVELCSELYMSMYLDSEPATSLDEAAISFAKATEWCERIVACKRTSRASNAEITTHQKEPETGVLRNRMRLLRMDWASKTEDPEARRKQLKEMETSLQTEPTKPEHGKRIHRSFLECWIRTELLIAAAAVSRLGSGNLATKGSSKPPHWLCEVPSLLDSFDAILKAILMQQKVQDHRHDDLKEYLMIEELFGLRRQQNGACMIRKADKKMLLRLLEVADKQRLHSEDGMEIYDVQHHFQPAVALWLSHKRLELLRVVAAEVDAISALSETSLQARSAIVKDDDAHLRHVCLRLWACDLQSKAEDWHLKHASLFKLCAPDGQKTVTSDRARWTRAKGELQQQIVDVLMSRMNKGVPFDLKPLAKALPRGIVAVANGAMLTHSQQLLAEWRQGNKSARALSVALCIQQSLLIPDIALQSLRNIAKQDARVFHPPLQLSGVDELLRARQLVLKDRPLASADAYLRFLSTHIQVRELPIDVWPMLELAVFEACVALSAPAGNGTRGLPHASKTLLPQSVAQRVRQRRGRERMDAGLLLLTALQHADMVFKRQHGGPGPLAISVARAAVVVQAVLVNFTLGRTQGGSGWTSLSAAPLQHVVKEMHSGVLTFFNGRHSSFTQQLGGCSDVFVVSPDDIKTALVAQRDTLICLLTIPSTGTDMHLTATVEISRNNPKELLQAQRAFVSGVHAQAPSAPPVIANAWFTGQRAQLSTPFKPGGSVGSTSTLAATCTAAGEPPSLSIIMAVAEHDHDDAADLEDLSREDSGLQRELSGLLREDESEYKYSHSIDLIVSVFLRKLDMARYEKDLMETRAADPRQWGMRYMFCTEQSITDYRGNITGMAVVNNGKMMFDSSRWDYPQTKASLGRFKEVYTDHISPALAQADVLFMQLHYILMGGILLPQTSLAVQQKMQELSATANIAHNMIADIDYRCAWNEVLETQNDLHWHVTHSMMAEVHPRIEAFVRSLMGDSELYQQEPSELTVPPGDHGQSLGSMLLHSSVTQPVLNPLGPSESDLGIPAAKWTTMNAAAPSFMPAARGSFEGPSNLAQYTHGVGFVWQRSREPPSGFPTDAANSSSPPEESGVLAPKESWADGAVASVDPGKIVPGMRCMATFHGDNRRYTAKVVEKARNSKNQWVVQFEGYGDSGLQLTHASDLFVPAKDNVAVNPPGKSSVSVRQRKPEPEADQDDVEQLGWSASPQLRRPTMRRYGGGRCPIRKQNPLHPTAQAQAGPRPTPTQRRQHAPARGPHVGAQAVAGQRTKSAAPRGRTASNRHDARV